MSSIDPNFESPGAIKIFDLTKPPTRDTQGDLESHKRLIQREIEKS